MIGLQGAGLWRRMAGAVLVLAVMALAGPAAAPAARAQTPGQDVAVLDVYGQWVRFISTLVNRANDILSTAPDLSERPQPAVLRAWLAQARPAAGALMAGLRASQPPAFPAQYQDLGRTMISQQQLAAAYLGRVGLLFDEVEALAGLLEARSPRAGAAGKAAAARLLSLGARGSAISNQALADTIDTPEHPQQTLLRATAENLNSTADVYEAKANALSGGPAPCGRLADLLRIRIDTVRRLSAKGAVQARAMAAAVVDAQAKAPAAQRGQFDRGLKAIETYPRSFTIETDTAAVFDRIAVLLLGACDVLAPGVERALVELDPLDVARVDDQTLRLTLLSTGG
jgi:hypothetical protein